MALRRYFGKISPLLINQLVGHEGEFVIDESTNNLYIMDGNTAGGHQVNLANLNIVTGNVYNNVIPISTNYYSLGNVNYAWNSLYLNDSLYLNNTGYINQSENTLTIIPNNSTQYSSLVLQDDLDSLLYGNNSVWLVTGNGPDYLSVYWQFNPYGVLVFPDGTEQPTAFSNANISTLNNLSSNTALIPGLVTNAAYQATQLNNLNAEVVNLANEVNSIVVGTAFANAAQINAANSNINTLTINASIQASYINTLNSEMSTAQSQIAVLQSNASTQETEISLLNANLLAANGQISILQANVNTLNEEVIAILSGGGTATFPNLTVTNTVYTNDLAANNSVTIGGSLIFKNQSVFLNANSNNLLSLNNASFYVSGNINAGNHESAGSYYITSAPDASIGYLFNNGFVGTTGLTPAIVGNNVYGLNLSANGNPIITFYSNGISYIGGTLTTIYSNVYASGNSFTLPNNTTIGLLPNFTTTNAKLTYVDNVNSFTQFLLQNKNSGSNASGDIVVTSDNGTDSTHYIDMGINSSTFSGGGGLDGADDGYLLVEGGKLLIATIDQPNDIIFAVGGDAPSNEMGRFKYGNGLIVTGNITSTGAITSTGNLTVNGNLIVTGNIVTSNYETISKTEYANSIIASGNITASGNVSATYYTGNGYYLTGLAATYGNTQVAAYLVANPQTGTYSNSNVASYLPTNSVITNINANITAANSAIATLQTQVYSNSNVTSYLAGNISVGNLAVGTAFKISGTDNNITTTNGSAVQFGQRANFNSANGIYVSGITNALGGLVSSANITAQSSNVYASNAIANTAIYANGFYWLNNGAPFSSSTYSNTSVAAYLPTYNGNIGNIVTGNHTPLANIAYNLGNSSLYWANAYANNFNALTQIATPKIQFTVGGAQIVEDNSLDLAIIGKYQVSVKANGTQQYTFGNDGSLTGPGGTFVYANGAVYGNVIATGIYWSNGVAFNSGSGGTYGNSDVANYLPTYAGNVNANFYFGNGYYLSGITSGGSSYSNTNVAAYLVTYNGNISAGNLSLTSGASGNITGTGYVVAGNMVANTNMYANGFYWFNNNTTLASTITGTYSNSNVASYMPTYTGNVGAGNILLTANGNIIAGTSTNMNIRTYGVYNVITLYNIAGGYNSPPYNNQSLTGGTGTGMTASYSSTGGYVTQASLVVTNPGTGYKNGDVLTLPGGLGTTVTLSNYNPNVTTSKAYYWTFSQFDGSLTTPGNILLSNTGYVISNNVYAFNNISTANVSISNTAVYAYTFNVTSNSNNNGFLFTNTVSGTTGLTYANTGNVVTVSITANGNPSYVSFANGFNTVNGYTQFYSNVYVSGGNVTLPNYTTIGLTPNIGLPNAHFTYVDNVNTYTQIVVQNKNSGGSASGDIVVTADNGTDTTGYIDMGINSSTFNTGGGVDGINDGYLLVQGGTGTGGGKLVMGTLTTNDVVFVINGDAPSNEVGRFKYSNGFVVAGNITANTGNVYASSVVATQYGNSFGTIATYTGNVTASNFVTTGSYGNITGANVITANTFIGTNATISGNLYSPSQTGKSAAIVAQNTAVTMDNIKVQWLNNGSDSANQLQLGSLSGTPSALWTYMFQSGLGGGTTGYSGTTSLSTTYANIGSPSGTAGDLYMVTTTVGSNAYRISAITGAGYSNNLISIERLV